MEDKVKTKEKVVVAVLKTSIVGLQVGWALVGIGLVGFGLAMVSTQVGYAALRVSEKNVS